MYPQIEFLGKMIGTYGLCAVLGLAVCVVVATAVARKRGGSFEDVLLLMLVVCGGVLVGGHLLYGVTQAKSVGTAFFAARQEPLRITASRLLNCFGGSVFYGGFLGGVAAVAIYAKRSSVFSRALAFDLYAAMTPLFHAFGRVGCFLGGCCYGKEWSWGFLVAENSFNPSVAGVVRIPVQLIEAGCELLIFFAVFILLCRRKWTGNLLFVYLLSYPVARFILEFYRGDEVRGFWFGLSTSQWISLLLLLSVPAKILFEICKSKKISSVPADET